MAPAEKSGRSGTSRSSAENFESLLQHYPDPAWIFEVRGLGLLKANAALASATEYSPEELLHLTLSDLFRPEDAERARTAGSSRDSWQGRSRTGLRLELEVVMHPVRLQGRDCKLAVARLRSVVPHGPQRMGRDPLTGLADRAAFLERLRRRILQGRHARGVGFAAFLIDLDRFGQVNKNLGLEEADRLLAAVARRLETLLHPDEMAARLEGDQFAMLLEDVASPETARHLAQEIQVSLEAPFAVAGREIQLTAGVGIAIAGPETTEPDVLLKNAEFALNEAKSQGPGGHRAFVPEMRARAAKNLRMELDLRPGIENGDLRVYYQPIVSVRSGSLVGFEALARWHHPDLGLIMPEQFISMAERTGIVVDLGKQVMLDACRQVCEWQSRFRSDPPLFVTVNCSAAQFSDPKLATLVRWALANSGLQPNSLKLELTETVLMEESPRTLRAVDRILDLGVQLIIDDFGTGYSSLSRLHRLPIEALKIDRSFVTGLSDRPESLTMARVIIQMARSFALKVTAEGVESEMQLRALRQLDCDFAQGFYFAKALEPALAEQLLASKPHW